MIEIILVLRCKKRLGEQKEINVHQIRQRRIMMPKKGRREEEYQEYRQNLHKKLDTNQYQKKDNSDINGKWDEASAEEAGYKIHSKFRDPTIVCDTHSNVKKGSDSPSISITFREY